jgi:uncharacterized membrane protein YqaE (UPF0057 family)
MSEPFIWRIVFALIFPPLAVLDKGCGTAILVFMLTMIGWFPGVIAALLISLNHQAAREKAKSGGHARGEVSQDFNAPRYVEVPRYPAPPAEETKRKGAFIRLEDGAVAEVIEDEEDTPGDYRRLQR